MPHLTIAILTFNEESRVASALESARFADEILVLDAGSTDATLEICRRYGARVETRPFDDFVQQRNAALELATQAWVLFLDADEWVGPDLQNAIRDALKNAEQSGVYSFRLARQNHYLGRPLRFGGFYPDRKRRLVLKKHACWRGTGLHEWLEVSGITHDLPGHLEHYSYRDLGDHVARIHRYTDIFAQQFVRRHAGFFRPRTWHLLGHPLWDFTRRFVLQLGFLDGPRGLIACGMSAFYTFLKYAKLWELRANPQTRSDSTGRTE